VLETSGYLELKGVDQGRFYLDIFWHLAPSFVMQAFVCKTHLELAAKCDRPHQRPPDFVAACSVECLVEACSTLLGHWLFLEEKRNVEIKKVATSIVLFSCSKSNPSNSSSFQEILQK
jgi:hypothetical protein